MLALADVSVPALVALAAVHAGSVVARLRHLVTRGPDRTHVLLMGVLHDVDGSAVDEEVLHTTDETVAKAARPKGWRKPQVGIHVVHATDIQAAA